MTDLLGAGRKLAGSATFAALFALAIASTASAATVYDTSAPVSDTNGNETTFWVQANSFSLGSDATVTGGGVYIAGYGGIANWDGTFDYWFFDDAGGAPGAAFASGAATVNSVTDTGTAWCCSGNSHRVDVTFATAVNLLAGATYWFGIHLSSDFDYDEIFWVATGTGGVHSESEGGSFDNWQNFSPSHAFYLTGDKIAPIPLPAALPLLASGLMAFGVMRLRRSRRA